MTVSPHLVRPEKPGKVAPEGKAAGEACPEPERAAAPHDLSNGVDGAFVLSVGHRSLRLHLQLY